MKKRHLIVLGLAAATVATMWLQDHRALRKVRTENNSLRQQVDELSDDSLRLSKIEGSLSMATRKSGAPQPTQLKAKHLRPSAEVAPTTDVIARLMKGENPPSLTTEQVEAYLRQSGRNAATLIAAFRASGDDRLLQEALDKYPSDSQVNFAAIFRTGATGEQRRQFVEGFKRSAPDNALGDYLSAYEYFKAGQGDLAVDELSRASAKPLFEEYSMQFVQNAEEAYRAAGYSEAESKVIAAVSLLLPHLPQLKNLSQDMVATAASYREANNSGSAHALLDMVCDLGQRLSRTAAEPLLNQMVGIAIERIALNTMEPTNPYGTTGQTVKDRLAELTQQRDAARALTQQFDRLQAFMSSQDWISYVDRQRSFGEQAALQWLVGKYGNP